MVVALVVTPALAAFLMSAIEPAQKSRLGLAGWLRNRFEPLIASSGQSLQPAVAMVAVAAVASFLVWAQRDHSLIPTFKETDILVDWQAAPGTSLPAMTVATQSLVNDIKKIPGVANVGAQLGRGQFSSDVADVNEGKIWVSLNPTAPINKAVAAIQNAANSYSGFHGTVESHLSARMQERLGGEENAVKVRIYGQDTAILTAKAKEVQAVLAKIDGVKNPEVDFPEQRESIEVAVDLDKARLYGLKPGDVRRAASAVVSGITVGALFDNQKVIDVVAWGAPEIRRNEDDVKNMMIETGSGGLVKLSDVATVKTGFTADVIQRKGVSRHLDVEAEVVGRPLGAVTKEVSSSVSNLAFPFEYHAEVIGEQLQQEEARLSLYGAMAAAGIMSLLLLQAAFGSWRLALLLVVSIPAALMGGVLMMLVMKDTSFLGGLIGLGAILGIAIRNGIALIKRFQTLEHEMGEDPARVIARGIDEQFRSIMTTAVTTALVALPFAVMGNVAGLEIAHPAAAVILGGLVTSTLFSLLVVPAVYARFGLRAGVDQLALHPEQSLAA